MSELNLETVLEQGTESTVICRDLRLNLQRLLGEGALAPEEGLLVLLATASSVGHEKLVRFAKTELASRDFTSEQIREATESAALMGMLNTYYRFKHFVAKDEDYRSAGLRMTALAKPVLGKERFEMLAFSVSIVNGCEMCVRSHEEALRRANVTPDKIHDLARLASVVKGLRTLEET